jgi:hypothetical protein
MVEKIKEEQMAFGLAFQDSWKLVAPLDIWEKMV